VQGSTDGSLFSTLVGSADYTFDPGSSNIVTITVPTTASAARYLRLNIAANTGWPAAQLSQIEAYGTIVTGPPPPTNLASGMPASASSQNGPYVPANAVDTNVGSYWESAAGAAFPQWFQVDLGASASLTSVVLRLPTDWGSRRQTLTVQGSTDGSSFSTLVGSADYTFDPGSSNIVTVTVPTTATAARYLRLNIAANTGWPAAQLSQVEAYGTIVTGPPPPTNLASGMPASASSQNGPYVTANAVDANVGSYWESAAGAAFPQWFQVDLGASASLASVVLRLPTGWGSRRQTLTVQGSADGSSFSTLVGSADYTFDPGSSNIVTITVPTTATAARYLRLNITANTGWPAAQLSQIEAYGH
jgi:hypothetical protein